MMQSQMQKINKQVLHFKISLVFFLWILKNFAIKDGDFPHRDLLKILGRHEFIFSLWQAALLDFLMLVSYCESTDQLIGS